MKSRVPSSPTAGARRRIVERFRAAKAISASKAITLAPEGAMERREFERLRAAGAIVEAEGGHFHLDEAAYEEYRRRARGKIAIAIGIAVAGALWALAS